LSLRFSAVILLVLSLCLTFDTASSQDLGLFLKVSPDGAQLVAGAPATLTLFLKQSDGQPSSVRWVALRLDAPAGGFFSTDFPVVEGSRLLDLRLPIIDGKVEWRQVFPIRGEYRLGARLETAAGAKTERTFHFRVYEQKQKWLWLGLFALGLFLLGMIAGRIFSAPGKPKGVKLGASLILFLAYGGLVPDGIWAQESPNRKYAARLEVAPATVGGPARIRWWLHPAGVEGKPSVNLTLSITQLEKNVVVFAVEKILVAGEFAFDYQFTDGSDHRVSAIAMTPDGETVRQEQVVPVSAVPPPSSAPLPTLALFISLIFLGLLAGRWSRKP
jgi:hypothetical protein